VKSANYLTPHYTVLFSLLSPLLGPDILGTWFSNTLSLSSEKPVSHPYVKLNVLLWLLLLLLVVSILLVLLLLLLVVVVVAAVVAVVMVVVVVVDSTAHYLTIFSFTYFFIVTVLKQTCNFILTFCILL
jgi:hypothetical protein